MRIDAARALAESLGDAVGDPLLVADEAGVVLFVNAPGLEAFGYSASEVEGRDAADLVSNWPSSPARDRLALPGRRRDGTSFPAEITIGRTTSGGHELVVARRARSHRAAARRGRAAARHRAARRVPAPRPARQLGMGHSQQRRHLVGRAVPNLRARARLDRAQLRELSRARAPGRPSLGRGPRPQGARGPRAVLRGQALHAAGRLDLPHERAGRGDPRRARGAAADGRRLRGRHRGEGGRAGDRRAHLARALVGRRDRRVHARGDDHELEPGRDPALRLGARRDDRPSDHGDDPRGASARTRGEGRPACPWRDGGALRDRAQAQRRERRRRLARADGGPRLRRAAARRSRRSAATSASGR